MEIICAVEGEIDFSFPGVRMVEETLHFQWNFQCAVWQYKSTSTDFVFHNFPSRVYTLKLTPASC